MIQPQINLKSTSSPIRQLAKLNWNAWNSKANKATSLLEVSSSEKLWPIRKVSRSLHKFLRTYAHLHSKTADTHGTVTNNIDEAAQRKGLCLSLPFMTLPDSSAAFHVFSGLHRSDLKAKTYLQFLPTIGRMELACRDSHSVFEVRLHLSIFSFSMADYLWGQESSYFAKY